MISSKSSRTESGLVRGIDIARAYDYDAKGPPGPLRAYVSYDEADRHVKDDIVTHLHPLTTAGKLELWSKDDTPAGKYWRDEITAELLRADVALVLMSASLFASKAFTEVELPVLARSRPQSGLRIVPILVRSCSWETDSIFSGRQILPASKKPIASLQGDDVDKAFVEIATTLDELAKEGTRPSQEVRTFFEFYGRQQHLLMAKASEAKHMIAAMARGLAQYAAREGDRGKPVGRFPPSSPLVPRVIPRGTRYVAEEHDWSHPAWHAIRFCLPGVLYFSYEFVTSADGLATTVRAHGDLLGDGKVVIYERQLTIDAYGHPITSPETIARERFG